MKKTAFVVGLSLVLAGAVHAADPSRKGQISAFAKVDTASGAVRSFGGKGTSGALGSPVAPGWSIVKFTGRYPTGLVADQLILGCTAESDNFQVANCYVESVSDTEIEVGVYSWKSNDVLTLSPDEVFVSVLIGRLPGL